jgi:circadian clock protein KaiC
MAERGRVKTGVLGLDEITGGGFKRGSIIVASGPTGAGTTTLGMQFLVNGAMLYKEPGLFVSFEEKKAAVYDNMKSYGWDIADLEKKRQLVFIEYPPHEINQFLLQEDTIRDLIDGMGIERIVIDSITAFGLMFQSPDERRDGITKLTGKLREWKATVMLTDEDSEKAGELSAPTTRSGIEILADGFIHVGYEKKGERRLRTLEVVKLRGTAHDNRTFPMKITSHGMIVLSGKGGAK